MRKFLPVFALLFLFSCKYFGNKKVVIRDTTINKKTSFNNLFFDSARIDAFIAENPQYAAFGDQFKDFYSHRNYQYAWFDTSGLAEQANNFINLQNSYINDFADSSLFNPSLQTLVDTFNVQKEKPSLSDPEVMRAELLLTGQFFQYAAKVYKGSDIDAAQLGWFIPRKKIDLTALLDSSLKSKAKETDQYAPQNSQYKKLQEYLSKYLALEKQETPDTIANVLKSLKLNAADPRVAQIKQRLLLLGDAEAADSSELFDSSMVQGVKNFQQRMGLTVDGVIGNKMIAELNVPVSKRIRQVLVNMERVRWMPAEKDTNYILVNIPEYKMHVYDSGHLVFDMNVIVGTAANSTVIFNGNLKYVVFSPYWNVPESIVKKEIMPSIKRNANYIARNNMEITGYSGGVPNVRQKPGPANSLGLVKFLFPNNYNIYFHDTPNRDLFTQTNRSFSHGCIRLGEPKKFAEYMLRNDSAWTSGEIDKAMHLSREKWVTVKKSVPVFIVYFTAWVDKDGLLNFRKDIYGHDSKMGEKLFSN
jgi:murein L,D-transpeptidase YcbB/YkuD